jgi:cysteine desulfurase/selenocysteine lyase
MLGPSSPDEHAGVISFVIDGVHPHDVATILDQHGVAVRAGHHCAQPIMARYDLPATTRASFYVYSDTDDIERLVEAIDATQTLFSAS